MKPFFLRVFTLSLLLLALQPFSFAQKGPGKYYVIANAGLNQRETEATNSNKITTVPYGEKVELLQAPASRNLTVDGLPGGMAKVKYNGEVGYMFDGYLVRFVPPVKGQKTEDFASRNWEIELNVMKEEINRDYGGYYQSEDAIYMDKISWADAFLLAKNHYGIPASFQFPGEKGTGEKTVKNINANKDAWSDELVAKYDKGKLLELYYNYRVEGGGRTVSIEVSQNPNFTFRIYERLIAD